MAYKIVGIDNRGSKDQPFGFIYIARGKHFEGRLGFGSHRDNPHPLAIWACRETPCDINALDVDRARDALDRAFPHLATEK